MLMAHLSTEGCHARFAHERKESSDGLAVLSLFGVSFKSRMQNTKMHTLASLRLHPGPTTVQSAIEWFEGLAAAQPWPPRVVFALTLCLDEALTNIVSYGFHDHEPLPAGPEANPHPLSHGVSDEGPFIDLELRADDHSISLVLTDNSVPFDPTAIVPGELAASLDEAMPGGHGVRLMRHYLQELHYKRTGSLNRLEMIVGMDSAARWRD